MAHGRGVILLAAEKLGVPIYEYTPMQVKQAVVGFGKAEKKQVMLMTQRLLHMKQIPRPDDAAGRPGDCDLPQPVGHLAAQHRARF